MTATKILGDTTRARNSLKGGQSQPPIAVELLSTSAHSFQLVKKTLQKLTLFHQNELTLSFITDINADAVVVDSRQRQRRLPLPRSSMEVTKTTPMQRLSMVARTMSTTKQCQCQRCGRQRQRKDDADATVIAGGHNDANALAEATTTSTSL